MELTKDTLAMEELRRRWEIQGVLYDLVCLLLEDISFPEALTRVVERVTAIPQLAMESRGGIFLVTDDPSVLVLMAHKGLPAPLQSTCARVPFGRCLCGRAASSGMIQFADCVDGRHENRWKGMPEHGHYCVPIMSGDKAVGVIYLHLKEGHRRDEKEEELLRAVAALLSGIIRRQQLVEELGQRNVALQQKVQELSALNGLFQEHLAIRDERQAVYERLVLDIYKLAEEAARVAQGARQMESSTGGAKVSPTRRREPSS